MGDVHATLDHLFRRQSGQLVATLTRVFGAHRLDLAEQVVQEALVAAMQTWPYQGIPENPAGWLMRVARNKALDVLRQDGMQDRKASEVGRFLGGDKDGVEHPLGDALELDAELRDDQLRLLFICCHPALARDAQVALALKTLFGFGVREIAAAFLTPEATVAQRLVRAKARLADAGARFELPEAQDLPERLGSVLEALYLLFSEGYNTHGGATLVREDMCLEALRATALVAEHARLGRPEAHALAALMCFHSSRLAARTDAAGDLLLLKEQDRARWDQSLVLRGLRHLEQAMLAATLSEYHLHAGIAACHALAPTHEATDWSTIVAYYDDLLAMNPSPVLALNRAAAVAMAKGPAKGLAELRKLRKEKRLADYYLLYGMEGELRAQLGQTQEALACYQEALVRPLNAPERRFIEKRIAALL